MIHPEQGPNPDRCAESLEARLRALPMPAAPQNLEARLLAAIPPARPRRRWWSVAPALAAAGVAACFLVLFGRLSRHGTEPERNGLDNGSLVARGAAQPRPDSSPALSWSQR